MPGAQRAASLMDTLCKRHWQKHPLSKGFAPRRKGQSCSRFSRRFCPRGRAWGRGEGHRDGVMIRPDRAQPDSDSAHFTVSFQPGEGRVGYQRSSLVTASSEHGSALRAQGMCLQFVFRKPRRGLILSFSAVPSSAPPQTHQGGAFLRNPTGSRSAHRSGSQVGLEFQRNRKKTNKKNPELATLPGDPVILGTMK